MKKNNLPNIIVLFILTLITILFWISFSIYRVFTTKPEPQVETKIINPISGNLDSQTLDQIEERIYP